MVDLNRILDITLNKDERLFYKIAYLVLIVSALLIVDNTISINYNKVEQVSVLNEVLKDSTLNEDERNKLLHLRKETIFKESWKDQTLTFITTFNSPFSSTTTVKPSPFWHFVSSSWGFLLLIFILFIATLFSPAIRKVEPFVGVIAMSAIFLLVAWGLAKILANIPVFWDNPNYNYGINAIVCSLVIYLFYKLIAKKPLTK